MMLRMLNLPSKAFYKEFADMIEYGLKSTLENADYHTYDLGGTCGS